MRLMHNTNRVINTGCLFLKWHDTWGYCLACTSSGDFCYGANQRFYMCVYVCCLSNHSISIFSPVQNLRKDIFFAFLMKKKLIFPSILFINCWSKLFLRIKSFLVKIVYVKRISLCFSVFLLFQRKHPSRPYRQLVR